MDIIYRINFSTRLCYIGKLDNTNILEAHTHWYYDGSKPNQSSWETDWEKDVLIHGFKNQTFITSFSYWPVSVIKSRIIGEEISQEGFEALKNAWGKPDKETCEALCILLAKKDSANVKQQIDFLSKEGTLNELVSKKEFDRRKKAQLKEYKLIQGLWLNFKNRKKPVVEDMTDQIARMFEKALGRKEGAIKVTYNPTLARAITLKITQNTVDDLMDQLNRRANENTVWKDYIEGIENQLRKTAYTKSGNLRDITYGKLFDALYKYVDENNTTQLEILNGKADSQKLSIMLKKWLKNNQLEDILPYENNNNFIKDPFQLEAKTRFTNYIQTTYLNRPEIPEYNNWRDEWIESRTSEHPLRPGALYPTFLKRNSEDGLINNTSLKQKIYGNIKTDEEFIRNNWDDIYPEQIAYCLTKKDANFELSDNIETYDGFITTIELEKIQHY